MNLLKRAQTLLLTLLFMPLLALAQDGGVTSAPNAAALALALDPTDLGAMAKLVLDAVMTKQWGIVVSLGITILVAGLRKWVPENTKVGAWFRTKLGAIVMNFAISLGSGFAMLMLSGTPFSSGLVIQALTIAFSASGGWSIWKNVSEAIDEKKAQNAGVAAATATTPADTLDK